MDAEEVEQALKVMGVVGDNSKISKIEFKGGRCGGRRGWKVLPHPEILQGGLHLPIQENHRSRFLREGCHPGGGQTGTAEARKILWLALPCLIPVPLSQNCMIFTFIPEIRWNRLCFIAGATDAVGHGRAGGV